MSSLQSAAEPGELDTGVGPATAAQRILGEPTRPRGIGPIVQPRPQVVLVEGSTFCASATNGDIGQYASDGLFVRDTRVLSHWELRVDGASVEALATVPVDPYACVFICRAPTRPGHAEPTIIVERHRYVGDGMREDLVVRNFGSEAAGLDLVLRADADFADLFHVKEQRSPAQIAPAAPGRLSLGGDLVYRFDAGAEERGLRISAPGARADRDELHYRVVVPAQSAWTTTIELLPSVRGRELESAFPAGRPVDEAGPALRMRGWRASTPAIAVENPVLANALGVSQRDLGALRITDPEHPEDDVVAAGAPWFMTLFGRDSLITSWMMLPYAPGLAMGTLRTLARLQGSAVHPLSEEEPGRILHEVRAGADLSAALGGEGVYYGSVDATPLFVMLAGRALRWGVAAEELQPLRRPVERAIAWLQQYGDRDGDGFIEYQRATDRGLLNQGWKDSQDSISFRDGRQAQAPIALAEAQGYAYAAYRAGAELEEAWGDQVTAARWRASAESLRAAFHAAYWDEAAGYYAMALDGRKQRVDAIASNIGHCLWTGIVEPSVADRVVDRMLADDMFTGFGIRTLSSTSASYNPVSYHNGSVWPHDTAIAAAGMAEAGRRDGALRVIGGLLDALEAFDGRLPELFCGFGRAEQPVPVPYPTSCSPQAWAAATPFELLRIALDLRAADRGERFEAGPAPAVIGEVHIAGLSLGARRLRIDADPDAARVEELRSPERGAGHDRMTP